MTTILIALVLFVLINAFIIILKSKEEAEDDAPLLKTSNLLEMRTKQVKGLRENAIKRKFEESLEKRVKVSKKFEVESTLLRAGYALSYGELKILEYGFLIVTLVTVFAGLKNPWMAGVLGIAAKLLPYQFFHLLANQRVLRMEEQIGSFIQLVTERYKSHGDFQLAIKQSAADFKGAEPMYSEIQKTILDLEVGVTTAEALNNLSRRTGNRFLSQLSDYYEIASTLGTKDSRERIIGQAWIQFNEDFKMKQTLKAEIAGPRNEAYIMLAFIPVMIIYQSVMSEDYLNFMLNTSTGKMGSAFIVAIILASIWFINKKIGAPLD